MPTRQSLELVDRGLVVFHREQISVDPREHVPDFSKDQFEYAEVKAVRYMHTLDAIRTEPPHREVVAFKWMDLALAYHGLSKVIPGEREALLATLFTEDVFGFGRAGRLRKTASQLRAEHFVRSDALCAAGVSESHFYVPDSLQLQLTKWPAHNHKLAWWMKMHVDYVPEGEEIEAGADNRHKTTG